MKYAITGSTGKFGQTAIKTLLNKVDASEIVALARNKAKAEKLLPAGIEIRNGSYENVEDLTESLKGIDKLLFISSIPGQNTPRLVQHTNVVRAATEAGVKFIAYTSFPQADKAAAPLAQDHKQTEKLIKNSGIKYSFLRNNWYIQNEANYLDAGKQNQPFVYSAGDGRVGWTLEREYAEATAKVLLLTDPKNIYEFAGKSATYADLATAVQKATGNDFEVKSVTDDEYRKVLQSENLDQNIIDMMISFQDMIKNNTLAEDTNDLEDVLGHPLPSLEEAAKEAISKL